MGSSLRFLALTIFLVAGLSIQGFAHDLGVSERQVDNPNGPPPGWTFVGCYTDRGGARTLKAQSFSNATAMTPALCIEFCGPSETFFPTYGFAGVEFGQQCFCDGVIQLTANLTDSSECNLPCKGDDTLICGGNDRISVYTDGTPSPQIPTIALPNPPLDGSIEPLWQYIGCYSDNASPRNLEKMIGIADPNQCAAMCQNTFPGAPFLFAGSEFGQECWCGPTLASTAQRLPDIACASMGCFGSNQEACGGEFIMAVYQMLPRIEIGCAPLNLSLITLNIQAIFLDNPETSVPITMVGIEHHVDNIPPIEITTEAGILSACPTCPNPVAFHFIDLRLLPTLDAGTAINNLSVVHPGGTPNFVEITDSLSVFGGYCIRVSFSLFLFARTRILKSV
ncbi:WSC domain-containing protein [Flammula alnicola]|nr:WSC domain-containing protein [Flammula alnicola]